jgi:hypothetical protein
MNPPIIPLVYFDMSLMAERIYFIIKGGLVSYDDIYGVLHRRYYDVWNGMHKHFQLLKSDNVVDTSTFGEMVQIAAFERLQEVFQDCVTQHLSDFTRGYTTPTSNNASIFAFRSTFAEFKNLD